MNRSNYELVLSMVRRDVLKTPRIVSAFLRVDRANFVLPAYRKYAYADDALPHLAGQTIPQPSTVAFMLELLKPKEDHLCLEVGTGSGYTCALLAELCKEVHSIERIPELLAFAEERLKKYKNVKLHLGDGSKGVEGMEFDRILVTAEAPAVPIPLLEQLKEGGLMVIPVRGGIALVGKEGILEFYPGFAFVPLVGEYGYRG